MTTDPNPNQARGELSTASLRAEAGRACGPNPSPIPSTAPTLALSLTATQTLTLALSLLLPDPNPYQECRAYREEIEAEIEALRPTPTLPPLP